MCGWCWADTKNRLALTEAGAHVEYLYQRGYLALANVDDAEREENPILLYRRA